MSGLLLLYMGVVTGAVIVGASLSGLLMKAAMARLAVAFSAGVMLAVCLLYLIPDALAFQHGVLAGSGAPESYVSVGYALSLGFLSLLTVERYLLRAHDHHHGASHGPQHDCERDHEPPHHHQHDPLQAARELGVAWSTVLALVLHGLFDGIALYAAGMMPEMGPALAMAVILHKVPEAATVLTVLRRGRVPPALRTGSLVVYTASTPLGMLAAAHLLGMLSKRGVALLMAFVAGSLLHLVTGHLLPEATDHHGEGGGRGAYWVMLGGFMMLVLARAIGGG